MSDSKQVGVSFKADIYAELKRIAERDDRAVASVVRLAVKQYLGAENMLAYAVNEPTDPSVSSYAAE